jgi:hypothetical protein
MLTSLMRRGGGLFLLKRRGLIALTALLVIALIAGGTYVLRSNNRQPHSATQPTATTAHRTATVGPAGGTFTLSGISITIPPGAVSAPAELSVSQPHRLPSASRAPLAKVSSASGVQFDVSLDGGRLQPLKPLAVAIPLRGVFLPPGAKPSQALLYTQAPTKSGHQLLPTSIGVGNVLHVKLTHLSNKVLRFLDIDALVANIQSSIGGGAHSEQCLRELSTSATGKVRLGLPDGWTDDPKSPVRPCLEAGNGTVRLKIENRKLIVWQAATSIGTTYHSTQGNLDAEAVKLLTLAMFPDAQVQTFLGRSGTLTVSVPPAALPARAELRATSFTFVAEVFWIAINMIATMMTGTSAPAIVESVLDSQGVISCFQLVWDTVKSEGNPYDHVSRLYDLVTGSCSEKVAVFLSNTTFGPVVPNKFFLSKLAIVGSIKQLLEAAVAGAQSAAQFYKGTLLFSVEAAMAEPVAPSDGCLTPQQFVDAMRRIPGYFPEPVEPGTEVVCEEYGAASKVTLSGQPAYILLIRSEGGWNGTEFKGEGLRPREDCDRLPPKIRAYMKDACA